ncbi:unnamed protein product [Acanthoscelides obtectus]|uniref:Uncharacterized protein n=1 Tax=Acanthoscelides obtectus TaxID=200917 RepID=A0A9P0K0H6_ACAOB|nr:unnamed protein product [Acanthoscelides obtectus]CAK1633760.1 hypothetical protein AOBTE_LOCUS8371 [Acanthoscelides obtectus]
MNEKMTPGRRSPLAPAWSEEITPLGPEANSRTGRTRRRQRIWALSTIETSKGQHLPNFSQNPVQLSRPTFQPNQQRLQSVPTPMSVDRSTTRPSIQHRSNYLQNTEKPSYIVEELHNQDESSTNYDNFETYNEYIENANEQTSCDDHYNLHQAFDQLNLEKILLSRPQTRTIHR